MEGREERGGAEWLAVVGREGGERFAEWLAVAGREGGERFAEWLAVVGREGGERHVELSNLQSALK